MNTPRSSSPRALRLALPAVALLAAGVLWALLAEQAEDGLDGDRAAHGDERPGVEAPAVADADTSPATLDGAARDGDAQPLLGVDDPAGVAIAAVHTGDLVVEVRAADGQLLPDAHVAVSPPRPRGLVAEPPLRGVSDADGRVRFAGLPPGTATVCGERSGVVSARLVAGRETLARLQLGDGHVLHGRVLDADEQPVADAGVWLSGHDDPDHGRVIARSGDDGSFRVEDVGPGRWVGATRPPDVPSPLLDLQHAEHLAQPVTLRLGGLGAALVVHVVDAAGEPVADARVNVGGALGWLAPPGEDGRTQGQPPRWQPSDATGRAAFEGLPPRSTWIEVGGDGFADVHRKADLRLDEQLELTVELRPGCSVEGTVRGEQGEPLADATISAFYDGGTRTTISGLDGRYGLEGLRPGAYTLSAKLQERVPAHMQKTLTPGAPLRWDPRLVGGGSIQGRVVDGRTGEPIAGLRVGVAPPHLDHAFQWMVSTDDEGRYRFHGLPEGTYDVLVVHESSWDVALARVGGVTPRANEPPVTVDLAVDLPGALVRVVGQLLDDLGRAPPRASLRLVSAVDRSRDVVGRFADDGRFEFTRVLPGQYTLAGHLGEPASLPDLGSIDVPAGGDTDLGVLRLAPAGRLRVRLHPRHDVQLAHASLSLRAAHTHAEVALTRREQEATVEAGAGDHVLVCEGPGIAAQQVPVTLEVGLEAVLDLDVAPGVAQAVELRWGVGRRVHSYALSVRDAGGRLVAETPRAWAQTTSETLELHLAPGSYVLQPIASGFAREPLRFDVGLQPGPALVVEMD